MAYAPKILRKLNKVLNKVKSYRGQVYKRFIGYSGDPLLSAAGSVSKSDVVIYPSPALFYPKYQGISQNNDPYIVGGIAAQVGDIVCVLSADAITEEEIGDKSFCFVNVTDQYEEEFYILASDRINIEGITVAYQFLLRSRNRK